MSEVLDMTIRHAHRTDAYVPGLADVRKRKGDACRRRPGEIGSILLPSVVPAMDSHVPGGR